MKLLFVGCGVTGETIKHYRSNGWTIIGITNHVGESIQDAIVQYQRTLEIFPDIFRIYFCPDEGKTAYTVTRSQVTKRSHEGFCSFRKPKHGMIGLTLFDFFKGGMSVDSQYLMVGSSPEDRECAAAARIDFLWAYQARYPDSLDAPYIYG